MKLENQPTEIDRIDGLLLDALQHDAQVSYNQLGELVGLSAPAVMERLRKLEAGGVIRGYHTLLDARSLGLDIAAFIGVSVRDTKQIEAVERWVADEPRILECHHVTGGYTLLLKVKVRNTGALEELINTLRALEGVTSTDTMVVFSTSVERTSLAFAIPDDEPGAKKRGRPRKSRGLVA